MSLTERVLGDITNRLPDVDAGKALRLAMHLTSEKVGVRTLDRLYDVSKEDMTPIVSACDATALHRAWQKHYNPSTTTLRSLQNLPATEFKIDWQKVNRTTLNLLQRGKRLNKQERCGLVNAVVKDVIARKPNCPRKFFKAIAADMVKEYPLSLQDYYPQSNPLECTFLSRKLSCKFDEEKRSREKREYIEAPNIPQAYGCKRWRVREAPEGETMESLTQKRDNLKQMFSEQRPRDWSWPTILDLMKVTYKLQRDDINSQTAPAPRRNQPEPQRKTTQEICRDWPFLFLNRGMDQHFKILTGVDFRAQECAFEERVDVEDFIRFLVNYNRQKKAENKQIMKRYKRAVKHNTCPNPHNAAILLLLINSFKENQDKILIETESTTPIEQIQNVPATPCIISLGPVFSAKKFCFAMDSCILSTLKTFWEALFMVFESYFVFNIKYPADISNTLEFYQRVVAQIAPERGSKTKRTGTRSNQAEKLQTLMERYSAVETDDDSETIDDGVCWHNDFNTK